MPKAQIIGPAVPEPQVIGPAVPEPSIVGPVGPDRVAAAAAVVAAAVAAADTAAAVCYGLRRRHVAHRGQPWRTAETRSQQIVVPVQQIAAIDFAG